MKILRKTLQTLGGLFSVYVGFSLLYDVYPEATTALAAIIFILGGLILALEVLFDYLSEEPSK